ncbi:hypothetical protein COT78_02880 [Candidatus Berkelbacteria bacterium CG10_big_fil_rev_8_21_14_0_10_43_13]|uniref:LytR/CpsA/Psr regulator C-terminal domain-containing protein n=1 Tax=Candidatus Berkelbacteria bacterium CG10_big_fil_rev_8_21_14_0_10_43_13 TaxID=1974514 RepID=A0A2H0W8F5_9BACT|nr:MAG: hypothetical protein COT78_02880 [Candidatus Berkelbacteria bacterium CG10_big_fil_rev_8_21_14_0_10_43_13]
MYIFRRREMGISDDISPRRNHHSTHAIPKPEIKLPVASDDDLKPEKTHKTVEPKKKTETDGDLFTPNNESDFFPPSKKAKEPIKISAAKTPTKEKNSETDQRKTVFSWRQAFRNIIAIVIIVLLTILIYSNIDSIKNFVSDGDTTKKSGDANAVTVVETPAAPDKTTTTIQVLNGSGVNNIAATYKTILSQAGYNVAAIGNASRYDYWSTYVYYKTGYDTIASDIKTVLKRKSTLLKNDDTMTKNYDIVIIMGSH